jgi:hypothetical protein
MKTIVTLLFLLNLSLACTGDCMTCHPNLMKNINTDMRHKPMLTCINCHSANPNSMAECGSDCFACHPVEKIEKANITEHKVIRECRDCHMKMKVRIDINTIPQGQSSMPTLRDFLKH